MKEYKAIEKIHKKMANKRKFYSTSNLPTKDMRVKTNDMFMVSPKEVRKYRKELAPKVGEASVKTTKNKNLDKKQPEKTVMESHKLHGKEKKNAENYQWLLKRNIVKLLGSAKKKTLQEDLTADTKTKTRANKVIPQKIKSASIKEINYPQKLLPISKSEPKSRKKEQKANNPDSQTRGKLTGLQRPRTSVLRQSEYLTSVKNNAALVLHPEMRGGKKSNVQRLKNVFSVFNPVKDIVEITQKTNKKLDLVYPNENSLYTELKLAEEKLEKKNVPKKNTVPKSEKLDESSTIHLEKPKTKKKTEKNTPVIKNEKTQTADASAKKKKGKLPVQK